MGTLLEEMTRAETTKAPSTTGNTSVLGNNLRYFLITFLLKIYTID